MKKLVFILVYLLTISCPIVSAEIIKTASLSPMEAALEKADADTLVIFDVDDVLITAKDQILQPPHHKFAESLEKTIENRHSEEEAQKLWSIIWKGRFDEPVNPQLVSLIKDAQLKGIKVMALTNAWTGSFGIIPSLEEWRIQELEGFGYSFKNSWNDTKPKVFINLKPKDPKRFPVFKSGIVFTCNLPKGEVLKAFLLYVGFSPKKIIFVDDKRKNLNSVEAFCHATGKQFIGFEYTAVAERPKIPLNEKRAQLQFDVLEKEQKWLSDNEVDVRMQSMIKPVPKTGTSE